MTVEAKVPSVEFLGDGVSTVFPTGSGAAAFTFDQATDLEVRTRLVDGAVWTVLTLATHYTVSGGEGASGSVTFLAAPATGLVVSIRRRTARTQPMAYSPGDTFPAESHEGALDRTVRIVQELGDDVDDVGRRALLVPPGEALPVLPAAASRAGKFMAFDASGDPVMASGTGADGALRADLASPLIGSLIVAFTSGSPTGISRSLLARMREITSFKDDGALGDGLNDDTAELQSVIDEWAGTAPGRALRFPSGTYKVTAPLVIPQVSNARLVIEGDGARIFSTHAGILFDNRNEFASYRDIWLDGPGRAVAGSLGLKTSLYAGHIENVRIDNFETGLKLKTISGAIKRLHSGNCEYNIWIEDFSNIIDIHSAYFQTSGEGIYVPNTSGGSSAYVAQLKLDTCAFEVMRRSVYAPSTINRFSAFNCWTERETVGSFVLVDTPAYIFNTNFVTFQPSITFSGGFPAASKQSQFVDAYTGQRFVSPGTADITVVQFDATVSPDSPTVYLSGTHFSGGNGYTTKIGFGKNAVIVDAPNFMPRVANNYDLGRATEPWKELFLSSKVSIGGNQIITTRQVAIPDTAGAALAVVEAEVNKLKAMCRAHGLIA